MTRDQLRRRLLHGDEDLFILDKPAGLPVHKGCRTSDDLERHLPFLCEDGEAPPRLAHRLDKDTSGCLVLGRSDAALARLGLLFAARKVEKTYWAVIEGVPPSRSGRISEPLRKVRTAAGDRVVPHPDGKPAITDYEVLRAADGLAWVALRPLTGRSHQLRAHCAALGVPMLGDPLYGRGPGMRPLHLHARMVRFSLWPDGPSIEAEAPLPPHFTTTFAAAGWTLS